MKSILLAILIITMPQFVHAAPYQQLLAPHEKFLKVVYPQGRNPIARQLAVVYYLPRDTADPIGNVRAFAVVSPSSQKPVRIDLLTTTFNDTACAVTVPFDLPLDNAAVVRLTPRAAPQLILFGASAGGAGFTTTSIFTLTPQVLRTRTPIALCEDSQLQQRCADWALQHEDHSPVLYNKWVRAESIDDIQYVLRQVRGE